MARVATRMQALGNEPSGCAGCDRAFDRGSTMVAVEYDDGEPAGWFCATCIAEWKVDGHPPEKGNDDGN